MIVDAHTHLGMGGAIVAGASELIASLDSAGIDKALVFAGEINDCPTARLLSEVAAHAGRLYPIGSISPLSASVPSLEQVEDWLIKKQIYGLKFYPGYEYFYPADAGLRPYLELLAKYNQPAIFHSGDTYSRVHQAKLKYAQSIHIDDLATELPQLKIVIAHLGYPWVVDTAEVCYKNKNVYADCSGFVYGAFDHKHQEHFKKIISEFIEVAGTDERILFGTDWPIGEQSSYLAAVTSIFGSQADAVFYKNACRLFCID